MKQRVILIIIAIMLVLPSIGNAQFPTFSGVVSVDTVVANPGSHFGVPIRLSGNDLDIAGLQIPLQFDSDYLIIDSISFVGSLLPAEMYAVAHIDNANDIVDFIFLPNLSPTDPIPVFSNPPVPP